MKLGAVLSQGFRDLRAIAALGIRAFELLGFRVLGLRV